MQAVKHNSLGSYLNCYPYVHIAGKNSKQPFNAPNKAPDLVVRPNPTGDFSVRAGYSEALAGSRLFHCMVSAPFPCHSIEAV